MTTLDWMTKRYQVQGKAGSFASVMTDNKGNIYSYGYHYPLLFRIGGLDFINNAGYSSTTSKHISWAWRVNGYADTIPVELPRRSSWDGAIDYTLEDILKILEDKQRELVETMSNKKRRDTQVYDMLVIELGRVKRNIERVEQAL